MPWGYSKHFWQPAFCWRYMNGLMDNVRHAPTARTCVSESKESVELLDFQDMLDHLDCRDSVDPKAQWDLKETKERLDQPELVD